VRRTAWSQLDAATPPTPAKLYNLVATLTKGEHDARLVLRRSIAGA